jgi:hypothetical protein
VTEKNSSVIGRGIAALVLSFALTGCATHQSTYESTMAGDAEPVSERQQTPAVSRTPEEVDEIESETYGVKETVFPDIRGDLIMEYIDAHSSDGDSVIGRLRVGVAYYETTLPNERVAFLIYRAGTSVRNTSLKYSGLLLEVDGDLHELSVTETFTQSMDGVLVRDVLFAVDVPLAVGLAWADSIRFQLESNQAEVPHTLSESAVEAVRSFIYDYYVAP